LLVVGFCCCCCCCCLLAAQSQGLRCFMKKEEKNSFLALAPCRSFHTAPHSHILLHTSHKKIQSLKIHLTSHPPTHTHAPTCTYSNQKPIKIIYIYIINYLIRLVVLTFAPVDLLHS
jgi:hypothetical protein